MEKILSMIGLAHKAGRVEIGEEPVGSAARAKKARIILVAGDAAASSVRRAMGFANTGSCLCLVIPASKEELGRALGRTSCAMAAITDMGFADEVLRLAYEKTVYKKQKMDWDYMNGILCGWHRKNLHTLAEVEAGDRQRRPAAQPAMQGRPAAPGEADQRVREDLERMREFLRRQQETEGE